MDTELTIIGHPIKGVQETKSIGFIFDNRFFVDAHIMHLKSQFLKAPAMLIQNEGGSRQMLC